MSNCRLAIVRLVVLAIVVISSAPTLAQSMSSTQARARQKAEFEQRLRESRARLDAAQRKAGLNSPNWNTSPRGPDISTSDINRMSAARTWQEARRMAQYRPEYKFDGGREFAYRFVLALSEEDGTRYIAGYAAFQPQPAERGRRQLLVRDNLQETHAPSVLEAQMPGELTAMLDRTLHVDDQGEEPRVDDNLPALLGDATDWFFPRLPPTETVDDSGGQTVIRESDGQWDTSGFYDKSDRSAKGYFSWSVTPRGVSGGILSVNDKRTLRSDDGTIELVGEGSYAFDMNRGIMRERRFRGTYKTREGNTRIAIEIMPAPTSALGQ
jgi:type II secretory pathway pseudopilin PulG